MDENTLQNIHELDMARMERANKRLFILTLVLVILLVGSNIGWLIYESQFQVVESTSYEQEVEQDTNDGGNNINTFVSGGDYYGTTEDKNNGQ